jgi:DNA modification methylase
MSQTIGQYQLIYGDAAQMDVLGSDETDLIVTSPPYFDDNTEHYLRRPASEQDEVDCVGRLVAAFAYSLRPVFEEMARILRPRGVLVVQTKDIRYGGFLLPMTSIHRELAESAGMKLFTRAFWHRMRKTSPSSSFAKSPRVGSFRNDDVEELLFFAKGAPPERRDAELEMDEEEIKKCLWPLWHMSGARMHRIHPHQSPKIFAKRCIALFSEPGDLVVDPFAGSAMNLKVAVEMNRRAVGYEITEKYARLADSDLMKSKPPKSKR